jgi:hypothetical protein
VSSGATLSAGITVLFPAIGQSIKPYATANVTAFSSDPGFCRLGELGGPPPWAGNANTLQFCSVDCFSGTGAAAPSDFFLSYTSH